MIGSLINLVIYLVIVGCIFGLLLYLVSIAPIPEPYKGWLRFLVIAIRGYHPDLYFVEFGRR